MANLTVLIGANEELVHQVATYISAQIRSPVLLVASTEKNSIQQIKQIASELSDPSIVLIIPWNISIVRWLKHWNHQSQHGEISQPPITLKTVGFCLEAQQAARLLESNEIVDEQVVAERFAEAIESADQLLLDPPNQYDNAICRALQPTLRLSTLENLTAQTLYTRPIPAWQSLLNDEAFQSFVPGVKHRHFETRKPLHRERFKKWLQQPLTGLLRAKGFLWFDEIPEIVMDLSIAGSQRSWNPAGTWWIGLRRSHWPTDPEHIQRIQDQWHPDFGDRIQSIAFVGLDCDMNRLLDELNACVLTDKELGLDWKDLAMTPDPFSF